MPNKKNTNIAVFYHGNCPDGFGGAYAAWKKLGDKASYTPLLWQRLEEINTEADLVFFVDFTPEILLKKFKGAGKRIIVIDHHITAEPLLPLANEHIFDLDHSGAVLAWQYFHPGKKTPNLLLTVEDQDTWHFKLKGTKEISKLIAMTEFDFKKWDKMAREFEDKTKLKKAIEFGSYILKYDDAKITTIIGEGVRKAKLDGKEAYVVNSPMNESMIGNIIAKDGAIGIVWSERRDGAKKVSLRSVGNIDVAALAKKYGGGGHKNAAGFTVPALGNIPWKYIK